MATDDEGGVDPVEAVAPSFERVHVVDVDDADDAPGRVSGSVEGSGYGNAGDASMAELGKEGI